MKGNVSDFLQAVLNDMLIQSEEVKQIQKACFPEVKTSDVAEEVCEVGENTTRVLCPKGMEKEDEEFLEKLNKLIHDHCRVEIFRLNF